MSVMHLCFTGLLRHCPSGRCGLKYNGEDGLWGVQCHCPSGRCGLKCSSSVLLSKGIKVTDLRDGVDWNIIQESTDGGVTCHCPSGRCGLKCCRRSRSRWWSCHCPSGRCGLKYNVRDYPEGNKLSLSFGAVWIEIWEEGEIQADYQVTVLRDGVD